MSAAPSTTDVSFPRALGLVADRRPADPAVVCDGRTLTFRELDRAGNRMARAYAGLGVGYGDFVAISLPNSVEWFVACLAAWKLGAVPNPISPALPRVERQAVVDCGAPALVVGVDAGDVEGHRTLPAGFEPDASVSDEPLPDQMSPMERALASGGSTGVPKLICARQPARYDESVMRAAFAARNCVLIPGPLYHGISYASSWQSILAGSLAVVMPRFDAASCLELIEEYRVDRVALVPTMMQRIARLPEAERLARDVSSLEFVLTSGSPCPAWLMRLFIDWLGPDVMHESFGSTERIGGTVIDGNEWLAHPGSVGRPAGGVGVRIVDPDTGAECPPGVMGEIYMMPPAGPRTTYEYRGAEGRVDDDGWESVGDMGYLDDDGYLYIGDRRADMIITGGRNVFPAEVEAALAAHPAVVTSVVVGLPDGDLGQRIHAIVETDVDTVPDAAELTEHVRALLVYYKIPRSFEFVDGPLRDAAGKVRRSALRDARAHS